MPDGSPLKEDTRINRNEGERRNDKHRNSWEERRTKRKRTEEADEKVGTNKN